MKVIQVELIISSFDRMCVMVANMALLISNNHNIFHHMDVHLSSMPEQIYFRSPENLGCESMDQSYCLVSFFH